MAPGCNWVQIRLPSRILMTEPYRGSTKLRIPKEIDKFLNEYHLLKLNQDETRNVKRPMLPSKVEVAISCLPTEKNPVYNST